MTDRFCACGVRLSIANRDGVCDECHLHPLTEPFAPPVRLVGFCSKCRVAPAVTNHYHCQACEAEINHQAYLRRQKNYARERRAQQGST